MAKACRVQCITAHTFSYNTADRNTLGLIKYGRTTRNVSDCNDLIFASLRSRLDYHKNEGLCIPQSFKCVALRFIIILYDCTFVETFREMAINCISVDE